MLDFPLWKKTLIWGLCLLGVVLTTPNLFYDRVERYNDANALLAAGEPHAEEDLSLWSRYLPSSILNLGLDLRGGAHLLVEVQVEDVYAERLQGFWPEVRDALREVRDAVGTIRLQDSEDELVVRIANEEGMATALERLRELARPVPSLTGGVSNDYEFAGAGDLITVTISEAEKLATNDRTMQQSLEIIRRRVDEAGTREPSIQRQGERRILVQVPGIGSAEFHEVVRRTGDPDERPGVGNIILPSLDEQDVYYVLEKRPVLTGENLVDASPSFDQNGAPAVSFRLNPAGGRILTSKRARTFQSCCAPVLCLRKSMCSNSAPSALSLAKTVSTQAASPRSSPLSAS